MGAVANYGCRGTPVRAPSPERHEFDTLANTDSPLDRVGIG